MKLRDLGMIAPGDYLRFNVQCDAAAQLMAGPVALAAGEAMRHGHQLGIRLNKLQNNDPQQRL